MVYIINEIIQSIIPGFRVAVAFQDVKGIKTESRGSKTIFILKQQVVVFKKGMNLNLIFREVFV